jgi:hypothetical protein
MAQRPCSPPLNAYVVQRAATRAEKIDGAIPGGGFRRRYGPGVRLRRPARGHARRVDRGGRFLAVGPDAQRRGKYGVGWGEARTGGQNPLIHAVTVENGKRRLKKYLW